MIWSKDLKLENKDTKNEDCGGTDNHTYKCLKVETCLQVEDIECPPDSCKLCDFGTYCDNENINPPNPFPYPPPPPPEPFNAMIVGDSISHGMEGDFTWRWRLYYWRKPPPLSP